MVVRFTLTVLVLSAASFPVWAAETRTFYGVRGLNTIPDARFDAAGTVALSLSRDNLYTHGSLGTQLSEHLFLSLRQTAKSESFLGEAERLYPGLDAKIKLWDETALLPAAAVGWQSAFGHKRMAGEYFTLSKRWEKLDATFGVGWGRYGQAGHFKNPFGIIPHFSRQRPIDGEDPNGPSDWFTGERIGLFGGLSYQLPIDGLSVTADWNADRYHAEQQNLERSHTSPWGIGLQYQASPSLNTSLGLLGGDTLMGRLSLTQSLAQWAADARTQTTPAAPPFVMGVNEHTLEMTTALNADDSAPHIYQQALRQALDNMPASVRALQLTPRFAGLQGPSLTFTRRDTQNLLDEKADGAEALWHNIDFDHTLKPLPNHTNTPFSLWPRALILDQKLSLSEEDQGLFTRTSLLGQTHRHLGRGWVVGGGLRVNLDDNLATLNLNRPRSDHPIRSDVDLFAQQSVALEQMYLSYLKTLHPDFHSGITAGYLEEQYAGAGGEILYRPFGKNWALGAEVWDAMKRDSLTPLNRGLTSDHVLTGYVQGWYRFPDAPETVLMARAGRYLADDIGGTLSLKHRFQNGATLEGYATLTNQSDVDPFGGTTHLQHGLKLILPLGQPAKIPIHMGMRIDAAPIGRDAGQSLASPLSLYDVTEPFSLQHLSTHWQDIQK